MLQTFPPSKILQDFVAFYYTIKCHKSDYDGIISEYCLPSGFGHMGFHFRGSFYVIQKNATQPLPRFYTVGQQTTHYYFNSHSEVIDFYGVSFKPTGLWHLFGLDMYSIRDKAIETPPLFPSTFQKFTRQFDSEQETDAKIKLIENLLTNRFLTVEPQLNVMDSVIKRIHETYGCAPISDITDYMGISERYIQKMFKKIVGITPTSYKRIVRFNYMFSDIAKDSPIDCKGLSTLYNYYDFSHFSKDFKKYCGSCPSKFYLDKFNFLQEVVVSKAILGN